jgi:hypothetical protein
METRRNGVGSTESYQPNGRQKRSGERAGEIGDWRLNARVTKGANGAIRIRRVMMKEPAEQSKNKESDEGRSHHGRRNSETAFGMTETHFASARCRTAQH